ncbi:unnamed protein product [Rhizophagus irregularis]|nr:unnamed protein product [Rhizophagus irregularis]
MSSFILINKNAFSKNIKRRPKSSQRSKTRSMLYMQRSNMTVLPLNHALKAFLNQLESKGPNLELTEIEEDVETDCITNSLREQSSDASKYRILNKKIDRAEAYSKNKGREVMSTRLEELKKIHQTKSSRNIFSREIKKKLNDVSPSVIKMRIRTARNMRNFFCS